LATQYTGVGKLDSYVPPTATATSTYQPPTTNPPTSTPTSSPVGDLFIKTYMPSDSSAAKLWKSYIAKEIGNSSEPGTYDVATTGTGTARKVYRTIVVKQGTTYDGKGEVLTPVNMGDGSQDEGQCPVFLLEPGAQLKNVTITAPGCEGVHMMGDNRLENVHWQDIGEDAASTRSYFPGGEIIIVNCSGQEAYDKMFQFNSPCTVKIKNVTAKNVAKLVRQNGGTSFTLTVYLDSVTLDGVKDSIVRSDSNNCKVYYCNLKTSNVKTMWKLKTTPQTFGGLGNI
ncbi:MAG TPA: pectate lyase, partial [Bacillota bacterium]|nr:pectate lyase [Bacillota bacterium]